MTEKRYTIDEICELTGFSRRTVRYYVEEGLIEPPSGRGRGGFYYDSHLEKLQEIKALQERGLKLAAITEIFKGKEPERTPEGVFFEREIWVKYPIAEGIELHFSRDLEKKVGKKIAEIIRIAKSLMDAGGNEHD